MKRYPKRARPLWSVAKRRRPIRFDPGVSLTFGEGSYVRGETYTFTTSMRGSAPVALNYVVGPIPPRPGVLTFTTDGTTPHEVASAINADVVIDLPPVEVRL